MAAMTVADLIEALSRESPHDTVYDRQGRPIEMVDRDGPTTAT